MKNNIKLSFLILIFLLCYIFISISAHERSHVEINRIFGCDSEVLVTNKGMLTKSVNCTVSPEVALEIKKLHAQNEMNYSEIYYHFFVVFLLLLITIGVYRK